MGKKKLTFKILGNSDESISDPQEKIREINKLIQEMGISVHDKKINYQALHEDTNVGITELWGERDTQEDRVVVGELPEFLKLLEEGRTLALKRMVRCLQEIITHKKIGQYQGSTFCAVIIVGKKIYTVNLGDSSAFLVTVSLNGQVLTERLNKELHNPSDPKEKERIEALGHRIIAGRIAGMLAVSRAIGDNEFENEGLSHDPDIYIHHIEDNSSNQYIVLACDGLTEGDALTQPQIGHILATKQKKKPDDIAKELAFAAYEGGSMDNISVLVMPLDKDETRAKYMAVFDGHGGDQVAEELSRSFAETFKQAVTFYLT